MINALELENYKCFTRLQLPLGNLTLFTGLNGAGKSSALQPLLLLAQGYRSSETPRVLTLNGSIVRLGTAGEVLPSDNVKANVSFRVWTDVDEGEWTLGTHAGDRFLTMLSTHRSRSGLEKQDLHETDPYMDQPRGAIEQLRTLTFLSAVREGMADAFPAPDTRDRPGDVGVDGRFGAYWYDQFVDEAVPEQRRYPLEPATSLRKQLDAWLGTLFPGAQANVQSLPQVSLLGLKFRLSDIGDWRRPANVGYGFTYAFPILVALLTVADGGMVIIDSPEAHLHPSAQSQMGRLLAFFAGAGVQVAVETHSDHLLNGARLAVKERVISHEKVKIHFFTGPKGQEHGVVSPRIDSDGRVDEWPEGFFDQSEKDLSRIAGGE